MTAFLEWNMQILRWIAQLRTPIGNFFNAAITYVGDETIFIVIALAVFWCIDKRRGYYLMMNAFFGAIFSQFLKITCRIPRPWVLDPEFKIVEAARAKATGFSFPSGHSQNAFEMLGGYAVTEKRKWLRIVLFAVAFLVAFSRMYLGVHTPFDVVVAVISAIIFLVAFYPVYRAMETKPVVGTIVWCALSAITAVYVVYVNGLFNGTTATGEELSNYTEALKNGYTMLGAICGGIIIYVLDYKKIRFDTKAVWWAQLLKLGIGLGLLLAIKGVLKAPLNALLGYAGSAVRYFIVIIFAGSLWPLTFQWFAKLGQKKDSAGGSATQSAE